MFPKSTVLTLDFDTYILDTGGDHAGHRLVKLLQEWRFFPVYAWKWNSWRITIYFWRHFDLRHVTEHHIPVFALGSIVKHLLATSLDNLFSASPHSGWSLQEHVV